MTDYWNLYSWILWHFPYPVHYSSIYNHTQLHAMISKSQICYFLVKFKCVGERKVDDGAVLCLCYGSEYEDLRTDRIGKTISKTTVSFVSYWKKNVMTIFFSDSWKYSIQFTARRYNRNSIEGKQILKSFFFVIIHSSAVWRESRDESYEKDEDYCKDGHFDNFPLPLG